MKNIWCLEVWGDYACFTRPEMKVERVSYDVITPSAARAIFEAILWKPAIRWHVHKIEILNPIKWTSVRRNEVGSVVSVRKVNAAINGSKDILGVFVEDDRQQRAGLFLKDVRYRLFASFEFLSAHERAKVSKTVSESLIDGEERAIERQDEKPAKYAAMFARRAKKGQCFHRPYLGCREFSCEFRLIKDPDAEASHPINESRDLGWMLFDMDFSNRSEPTPRFFQAKINCGIINVPPWNDQEVRG